MVGSTYGGNGVEEKETAYIKNASKQAPVFLINSWIEGENIYCSNADDFSAAYEVTSALIRRGKKRILFLYDSETFRLSGTWRFEVPYQKRNSSCKRFDACV